MQFAPPITLDEMAVISLHALGESSDSNVRFCLAEFRGCPGRKANIQTEHLTTRTRAGLEPRSSGDSFAVQHLVRWWCGKSPVSVMSVTIYISMNDKRIKPSR